MAFPPLLAGFVKACGATFCGDWKLFTAFRSSPVSTEAFSTFVGAWSSQTISTSCDFAKSRLRINSEMLPSRNSRAGNVDMWRLIESLHFLYFVA